MMSQRKNGAKLSSGTSTHGLLPVLIIPLLLAACGEGSNGYNLERLPEGTRVTVNPVETEWEIVPNIQIDPEGREFCAVDPDYYQDELVTILVTDEEGYPLGDVEVVVSVDLTANTFSGTFAPIALYDDRNGDFIPDPDELVSGEGDPLYVATTGEYTGSKTLIVRLNLSCTYRGELQAVIGGYTGSASFDVFTREDNIGPF